jgi:hypothetical protein
MKLTTGPLYDHRYKNGAIAVAVCLRAPGYLTRNENTAFDPIEADEPKIIFKNPVRTTLRHYSDQLVNAV